MTTVRKILDEKAESRILTIPATATVFAALQVMCEGNTGAVLVTEGEKIVGIFTERFFLAHGTILFGFDQPSDKLRIKPKSDNTSQKSDNFSDK